MYVLGVKKNFCYFSFLITTTFMNDNHMLVEHIAVQVYGFDYVA